MDFIKKALGSMLSQGVPLKTTTSEAPPKADRSDLTADDLAWLSHLRRTVDDDTGFATGAEMSVDRRLSLIQSQLDAVTSGDMPDPQAIGLGAVLGDMIAKDLGLSWIVYEDESGRDLALGDPAHDVTLFPLSMILKRQVEREELNVAKMFHFLTTASAEKIKDGSASL